MSWIAGLIATTAGKAAAGTVLAAASVGGLHAADVVELPVLPEQAAESNQDVETTSEPVDADLGEAPEDTDVPEQAAAGQAKAEANRQAADEFTTAMRAWADCVAAAAPESETEAFDPVAACGERPVPSQRAQGQAEQGQVRAAEGKARARAGQAGGADEAPAAGGAETGTTNSEQGRSIAEQGEANADQAPVSDGTPAPAAGDAGSQDPTDRGADTPAG